MGPEPDPGGPKTSGSGSPTLVLAERLERLAANAAVVAIPACQSRHLPTQWNLWGADETVLNKVHKIITKHLPVKTSLLLTIVLAFWGFLDRILLYR
jgi:hypothetical protein